jgi:hypothetical protein
LFGGLLEGNHNRIQNGQKEAREEGLKSEAEWLLEGLPFTVDTNSGGGYAITEFAQDLDSGSLPHLKNGAFRSKETSRPTEWKDRYDLHGALWTGAFLDRSRMQACAHEMACQLASSQYNACDFII